MIGKLLVASPSILNDHVFSRSVILMIENSGTGSMGFIVNKQTIMFTIIIIIAMNYVN